MNFEDFKNKIVSELNESKANINMSAVDNFKEEKAQNFKFGRINLVQFIQSLSEDLPYKIVELNKGNYILIDKKAVLLPQHFIGKNDKEKVLTEDGKIALIKVFPEMKDMVEKTFVELNDANCKGCAKNSKFFSIVNEMTFLDNSKRDFAPLSNLIEENFINALKTTPPQKRPKVNPNIQPMIPQNKPDAKNEQIIVGQTMSKNGKGGPRASCVDCCMKHLGTAIVLLEEAKTGYPSHLWLAVGELNEAANEMIRDHWEIANEIRDVRLKVTDSLEIPDVMALLNKLHNLFFSDK